MYVSEKANMDHTKPQVAEAVHAVPVESTSTGMYPSVAPTAPDYGVAPVVAQATDGGTSAYLMQATPGLYQSAPPPGYPFGAPQTGYTANDGTVQILETIELECSVERACCSTLEFNGGDYTVTLRQRMKDSIYEDRIDKLNWIVSQCKVSFFIRVPPIILILLFPIMMITTQADDGIPTSVYFVVPIVGSFAFAVITHFMDQWAKRTAFKKRMMPALKRACQTFNESDKALGVHWSVSSDADVFLVTTTYSNGRKDRNLHRVSKAVVKLQIYAVY